MPRTKISEFSATPGDNTDIDGIDIAEGCAPSGINNAIRELMAQLKDMQTGSSGDTFTLTTVNSTTVDTTNLEATNLKAKDGTAAGSIANSTGVVTLASTVLTTTDINGGTVDGTTIGATTPSTVVATQVDITAQGDLRLQDTTGGQYVALQAPGTIATSYTLTLPVDDGTSGQALITDGSGVLSWSSAASGDVYGPASATDNAVARFDLTTGKLIQNSGVTIDDTGVITVAAGSAALPAIVSTTGTADTGIFFPAADTFAVSTAGTERMRIDSVGAVGIGGTPSTGQTLVLQKSVTGNVNSTTVRQQGVVASDVTSSVNAFDNVAQTAATAFTLSNYRHFVAQQGSFGAGSTVTNQYGFFASSTLTGATNNYGFHSDIASGTGRFNFYAAGSADNYFGGNVGIGTTSPSALLHVSNAAAKIRIGLTASDQYLDISRDNATGFTIYNAAQTSFSAHIFQIAGTERARIATTGVISLGAAPGSESLRVTPVASAVNYVEIRGQATTGSPQIYANGSDTNIFLEYYSKGTGNHLFYTNGEYPSRLQQFVIAHTASAVNYLQVTGSATGNATVLSAQGSDTNINLTLTPKGTGGLVTNSTGQTVAAITTTTLGGSVSVFDTGSSVGNGGSVVFGAASGSWRFAAIKSNVTSGSNNTQGDLYFLTRRASTDANLTAAAHITGAGVISLGSIQGSESVRVSPVASAVNLWDFVGSATGGFIAAYANGSDTNIDIKLIPKGTGVLSFGTYTAGVVVQAGYITIKDAGGTTRRLLVG